MMIVILKLEWSEDKLKQKAMKTVSGITGVESISMDAKEKKLTIKGDIDAVKVVKKLRKLCHTQIVSIGLPKEPEKPKKEEGDKVDPNQLMMNAYQAYCQQYTNYPAYAYHHRYITVEQDNPNACVIC